jgi:hypothetical protein
MASKQNIKRHRHRRPRKITGLLTENYPHHLHHPHPAPSVPLRDQLRQFPSHVDVPPLLPALLAPEEELQELE